MAAKNALPTPRVASPQDAVAYGVDAAQRLVLYLDALRKRGNQFIEHFKEGKPPVLAFDYDTVLDGRNFDRPVNYTLLRIRPKPGTTPDPTKRPFVIFDPRAGHGPGIGGFKEASQVGVALRGGHPCYFVSFLPDPVDGQTIEDIARAEAQFVRKVIELHPDADGKPAIVGNCQAGWAIMLMNALAPDLAGLICVAGAPLSYWAGRAGQNPMRYTGGMAGGSWMAALLGDLGAGRFDGVNLVSNFENLNPANTYWKKQYNLYAKVDTEEPRFNEFEKWWGGHFFMTTEEIRFIVDELFVGNKLARGEIVASDGRRVDLKAIKAPIVVIASWGDNITPPQQALNWICDLYRSVDEIRAEEQVIVYTLHPTIGHLGIFVSAKVALKEHAQFVAAADLIEVLPPGLYEMVIEETREGEAESYVARFETRTIDDILALDDGRKDEDAFAAVARISEVNANLYQAFVSPWVRGFSNRFLADWMRLANPARVERLLFSDANPAMWPLQALAPLVAEHRKPVAEDNPFLQAQEAISHQVETALDRYRDLRDGSIERMFFALYDSPGVRAVAGLPAKPSSAPRPRDEALEALIRQKRDAILARAEEGGFAAAVMRILLAGTTAQGHVDAEGARIASDVRRRHPILSRLKRQEIKTLAREQALLLAADRNRAIEALAVLLPTQDQRRDAIGFVSDVISTRGRISPEAAVTLRHVLQVLGMQAPALPLPSGKRLVSTAPRAQAKQASRPKQAGRPGAAARPSSRRRSKETAHAK